MKDIDKIYNPQKFEQIISKKWKEKRFFSEHDITKKPFTVILPPPNVTGALHIGHALNEYIQDTIIRYKKLEGYDVLWLPGMDHAGIATQSKIEKLLYEKEKLTKYDLGREKFVSKIWEWKNEYANKFKKQWDALGLSFDYDRERFTLDKDSNDAVNKAFIDLYNKGLIYKDTKAINWDPILKTALSNIEVINEPTKQTMYYIKYKLKDSDKFLIIATVRPETMLSDVAIVYNPTDKKYLNLKDSIVVHPLTNKEIPLIADDYVDKKFGSGLMKLSAHAEADIDIIKKHNLEIKESINKDGIIEFENSIFNGFNREEARIKIVEYLKQRDLILKEVETISNVGYSERTKVPVEILVMPQWFVKMDSLAKKVLDHQNSKDAVKFIPGRFANVIKKWMENIHDWTISRQLWWGHRIPAWYKGDDVKVQVENPGEGWVQESDVLDTWFSSALAPFSFLGWPNNNELLKRYYPTSLLVTGYDIIFFWVARMYFFSLEFLNQKPFNEVMPHGLVRDEQNRKMSKSLNNGIDPMKVIEEHGSDALRFFLVTNTTPGMDIRYSTEKIKAAWALCNKLWNIARYIEMLDDIKTSKPSVADLWINNKLVKLQNKISKALKKYELTIIGTEISNFIYNDFSSWYIELLKIFPNKKYALENLKHLLKIIHPFLPFITDYLYSLIFEEELLSTNFPILKAKSVKKTNEIDNIILVSKIIRQYRELKQISKKEVIEYECNLDINDFNIKAINTLSNAKVIKNNDFLITDGELKVYIKVSNSTKENYLTELDKKIKATMFEIERAEKMLQNENFVNKAPKAKIDLEKSKLEKYKNQLIEYKKEVEKWSY